jgi:hypothetical protein
MGSCEHGNEPLGSIKGSEFFDQLSNCQFLKKDCTLWSWLMEVVLCHCWTKFICFPVSWNRYVNTMWWHNPENLDLNLYFNVLHLEFVNRTS